MDFDYIYEKLAKRIITEGELKVNERTGKGTLSLFGPQYEVNISNNRYPLLTHKAIHLPSLHHELLWMISGDTNIRYLQDNGVRIWNEWADENGELGPIYGAQWRNWGAGDERKIDQLKVMVERMREMPSDRGHIISAWNAGQLDEMALRPCHMAYQFNISGKNIDTKMYQRSADFLLGVPFNTPSYTLLTRLVANVLGLKPRKLIHTFGDAHFYLGDKDRTDFYREHRNEIKRRLKLCMWPEDFLEIKEWIMQEAPLNTNEMKKRGKKLMLEDQIPFILIQLSRAKPIPTSTRQTSKLQIVDNKGVFDATYDDITVSDYQHDGPLDFRFRGDEFTPKIII